MNGQLLILQSLSSKVRLGEHTISHSGPDCTLAYDPSAKKMVPNPKDCNAGVQDFDIENIIQHPSYNSPHIYKNDIAVIKLKGKIVENGQNFSFNTRQNIKVRRNFIILPFSSKFQDFVKPICLPYEDAVDEIYEFDDEGEKQEMWVAGWGATDFKGK